MRSALLLLLLPAFFLSGCASSNKIKVDEKNFLSSEYAEIQQYKSVEKRDYVQDTTLTFAVAIAGGGSRSSNFAKGVLLELENIPYHAGSNVLREVDYFSTVSGGGHAAGAYIASLFEWNQQHNGPYSFNTFYKNEYNDLKFKYKTQGIYALFQRFPSNRSYKLEKRVDDHVLLHKNTGKSILLSDLFVANNSSTPVKYPMLIASATNQESKIQYPFSPDVLDAWELKSYHHRHKYVSSASMASLPLSVALVASGTVPLMVPPTVFQDAHGKYMRFVDGGLADNTGVATALHLLELNQDHVTHNRKKLLVIEDTPGGVENSYTKKKGRNKYQIGDLIWYGLDSKYFTFYQDIEVYTKDLNSLKKNDHIDYNILDFRTLLREPEASVESLNMDIAKNVFNKDTVIDKNEVTSYLLEKYEAAINVIPNLPDRKLLFEIVSHIPTKYEATDSERRILILAGRIVVRMQRGNIIDLLK